MKRDILLLAIRHQMRKQGIGAYELAQRLKGRVSQATVYNYVQYEKPAKTDTVIEIMDVLGLIVTAEPTKGVARDRKSAKRA
jgi:hypothetical protein